MKQVYLTDMPCAFCSTTINLAAHNNSFGTYVGWEIVKGVVSKPFHLRCWDSHRFKELLTNAILGLKK